MRPVGELIATCKNRLQVATGREPRRGWKGRRREAARDAGRGNKARCEAVPRGRISTASERINRSQPYSQSKWEMKTNEKPMEEKASACREEEQSETEEALWIRPTSCGVSHVTPGFRTGSRHGAFLLDRATVCRDLPNENLPRHSAIPPNIDWVSAESACLRSLLRPAGLALWWAALTILAIILGLIHTGEWTADTFGSRVRVWQPRVWRLHLKMGHCCYSICKRETKQSNKPEEIVENVIFAFILYNFRAVCDQFNIW